MAPPRSPDPKHMAQRRDAGLPPDYRGSTTLAFDGPTRTLIFACASPSFVVEAPRLYMRRLDASVYTSVLGLFATGRFADENELVVLSWTLGNASHLFLLVGKVLLPSPQLPLSDAAATIDAQLVQVAAVPKPEPAERIIGIDHVGVARLNLRTGTVDVWNPTMADGRELIVSKLMGTSKGDKSVYAVVGFPVPFGKGGTRVDYYVTRLAWAARSVRRMKPQPRIFF